MLEQTSVDIERERVESLEKKVKILNRSKESQLRKAQQAIAKLQKHLDRFKKMSENQEH
jgi:hypothetical protein